MATVLSSVAISADIVGVLTQTHTDGTIQKDVHTGQGTSVTPSDANILYHTKVTITGSGSSTFDLSGALTNALGNAAVFSKVYAIKIENLATTTGKNIRVGNAGTGTGFYTWADAETSYVTVGASGVFLLASCVDGYAVTATTGDILKLANPGGSSIDVEVTILGKS